MQPTTLQTTLEEHFRRSEYQYHVESTSELAVRFGADPEDVQTIRRQWIHNRKEREAQWRQTLLDFAHAYRSDDYERIDAPTNEEWNSQLAERLNIGVAFIEIEWIDMICDNWIEYELLEEYCDAVKNRWNESTYFQLLRDRMSVKRNTVFFIEAIEDLLDFSAEWLHRKKADQFLGEYTLDMHAADCIKELLGEDTPTEDLWERGRLWKLFDDFDQFQGRSISERTQTTGELR